MMFDIIGDIHGQAKKLVQLLAKLGYQQSEQGFYHPQSKAIFVGDFIDRGPEQIATLNIVKNMVDNHNAYAVMGNHEFNAIGWVTPNQRQPDCFLRKHNYVHHKQHKVFLDQVGENSKQHHDWINWFKSLPLWLDFDKIRIIHACWDNKVIHNIEPYLDSQQCLKQSAIQAAFDDLSPLFAYCEVLLKGKVIILPDGIYYHDKEGTKRHKSRIRWWLKHADTFKQLCLLPDEQNLTGLEQKVDFSLDTYQDEKPVFFGHYWLTGVPMIQTPKVACVDYSAAIDSGKLVAYRWQGEQHLSNHHFIY